MRWCVVMSDLNTTTQLVLVVLSNKESASWGMFTFISLVQWIKSGNNSKLQLLLNTRKHLETLTVSSSYSHVFLFLQKQSTILQICLNFFFLYCVQWDPKTPDWSHYGFNYEPNSHYGLSHKNCIKQLGCCHIKKTSTKPIWQDYYQRIIIIV